MTHHYLGFIESQRVGTCAAELLKAVRQSAEANITWLGDVYLALDMLPFRRSQIIDALIDYGSPASQQVIVEQVSHGGGGLCGLDFPGPGKPLALVGILSLNSYVSHRLNQFTPIRSCWPPHH